MRAMFRLLEHPATQLTVAAILIVTSCVEGFDTLWNDLVGRNIGAHHGVFVFGAMSFLKTIPELLEGVDRARNASGGGHA